MSLTTFTAIVATALLVPFSGATSPEPEPQPGPIGQFEGGDLEVGEDRLLPGGGTGPPPDDTDWDALWQAYMDDTIQECLDNAIGPLQEERCRTMNFVITPGAPPVAGMPAITISDIARFTPLVGELVVEPDGWGVVGTPTNFYATAETHTMDGELFDIPIQVRWTPSTYRFDYGDGTVEETEGSGSAWQGTDESWTETATSHTYDSRDDVTASVTVIFTAEVEAGAGWFAVPGTLPVDAPGVSVKIFEVDTVLTEGDCMAHPTAPGCG